MTRTDRLIAEALAKRPKSCRCRWFFITINHDRTKARGACNCKYLRKLLARINSA